MINNINDNSSNANNSRTKAKTSGNLVSSTNSINDDDNSSGNHIHTVVLVTKDLKSSSNR